MIDEQTLIPRRFVFELKLWCKISFSEILLKLFLWAEKNSPRWAQLLLSVKSWQSIHIDEGLILEKLVSESFYQWILIIRF